MRKNFVADPLSFRCFRKILVSKSFMHKREEGVLRYFVEKFYCHSTEKFREGSRLCYRKLLVSKNVIDKRAERGSITISCWIFFCLTVPKNFVGEPLGVSAIFEYRKFSCKRTEEVIKIPRLKKICVTVPRSFVKEPFCVRETFWYRKKLWTRRRRELWGGSITIFCGNCFVSQ